MSCAKEIAVEGLGLLFDKAKIVIDPKIGIAVSATEVVFGTIVDIQENEELNNYLKELDGDIDLMRIIYALDIKTMCIVGDDGTCVLKSGYMDVEQLNKDINEYNDGCEENDNDIGKLDVTAEELYSIVFKENVSTEGLKNTINEEKGLSDIENLEKFIEWQYDKEEND